MLHLLSKAGHVLIHGKIHGLHGLQELVGGTYAIIEVPFGIHGGGGAPVSVVETLDGSIGVSVFCVIGTAVTHGATYVNNVLVGHISVDVGKHLLDVVISLIPVLARVYPGCLIKIQEMASCHEQGGKSYVNNLFHIVSRFRS